jgi:hypothetical protein
VEGDQNKTCKHISLLLEQSEQNREPHRYLISLLYWLLTTFTLEYPQKQELKTKLEILYAMFNTGNQRNFCPILIQTFGS